MEHQCLAWLQCLAHCLGLGRAMLGVPSPLQPPFSPYSRLCKSTASTLGCPFLLLQLALHRDCSLTASGVVYLLVQHQMVARQCMLHKLQLQHSPQSRLVGSTLVCLLLLEWQHTAVLQAVSLRLQLQHQRHPLQPLPLSPPLRGSGQRALLPSPVPLLFSLENSSLSNSSNNRRLALPSLTPSLPPTLFVGSGRRGSPPLSQRLQPQPSLNHSHMSSSSRAQLLTASLSRRWMVGKISAFQACVRCAQVLAWRLYWLI